MSSGLFIRDFLDYLIDEGVTLDQIEKAANSGYVPAKPGEESEFFGLILDILSGYDPHAQLRERP